MDKFYAIRDSAIAAARKAGVRREDYPDLIQKVPNGWQVTLPDGGAFNTKNPPRPKKATEKGGGRKTVAGAVRGLVAEGKTNKEIWASIQREFGLPEKAQYYPAWYRNQALKRARKGAPQ